MQVDTKSVLLGGCAAIIAVIAAPAYAQTATAITPAQPAASTDHDESRLDEIIVTAQRRSENLQNVPVAVTAVGADALQELQIVKPSQLVFVAPALQQQATVGEVGATNFSIRGIGTAVFGPGIEASVATVLDDVTLARPQLGVIQFFDLDNVQILRGPQGMLFGKNASAGVVSITTRRPQLNTNTFDFYSSIGAHDSIGSPLVYDGNATANLALGSNAALRVSAFGVKNDSFVNQLGTQGKFGLGEYGGRVKLLWQPSTAFEVYLSGDYVKEEGVGDGALTSRYDAPGGLLQALHAAGGVTASPTNLDDASNALNYQKFTSGGAQANVRYKFGSGYSLTNIFAYRFYRDAGNNDVDSSPFSLGDQLTRTRDLHQVSDELRLTSPSEGRFTYQIGLYYLALNYQTNFDQRFNLAPIFPPPPPGVTTLGAIRSEEISSTSAAIYGQGEIKLIDGFGILFGGRYTNDRTSGRNIYDATGFLIPLLPPGDFNNRVTNDNFSYKAGLNWQINPNFLVYATYARGYKGPALDETSLAIVRPEIPHSGEIGLKSTLFDRKLSINLAVYRAVYDNFQAQAYQAVGNTGNFTTLNAGKLRVQGVEADFRARPFSGLTLSGGAAFSDGVYESFPGAPCYPNQQNGTSGRFVCLPNQTTDVSGGDLANSPKFTLTTAAQYEIGVGAGAKAYFGADIYHRSSLNFSVAPDPKTRIGAIDLIGARIGFRGANDRWEFEIFVRNLTDKRFPTYVTSNPFGGFVGDNARGGDYYQTFGAESFRTIGASFTGHF
jgi:iron complex outermembrane receptor protein